MNKGKFQVGSYIKEITIVVIGVLIAVAINNLKERIDNQAYIKKTLISTEKEIAQNEESVNEVITKHTAILDSLSEISSYDSTESIGELISRLGGVQSPGIKNIGLRFFIANKAELIDYELISILSEIEINSTLLDEKLMRLTNYSYDNVTGTDEEIKIKFAYLLANVIDSEQVLLELYEEFKKKNQEFLQ
jgi:hypothetical protein